MKVMRLRTKLLLMVAAMVTLAFLLTACGGDKPAADKKAPATDASKTQAPKTEPTKADSSGTEAAKKEAPKADAAKTDAPKADAVDATKAKAIMDKTSCATCHASGKPLDKIGSKYNATQLTDFLKTEHPVKFELSDSDLGTLTSYLASLK